MAHKDAQEPPASERSVRNPRRRNRVESESLKVAPRRKRSKITENTFLPRDTPEESAEEDAYTNGHTTQSMPRSNGRHTSMSLASGDVDMPVRGARNSIKRTARVEGARVLTQNENYSVKLFPSTPKELQQKDVQFRGSISVASNLALAITKEKAYIWEYNGHLSGTSAKTVDIPFHSAQHDPLPLGAFVSNSGSDLGLLLVSATSGKVVYHESIERVTSLGFFQERKEGNEGAIAGLFSGEKVVQLTSAEPAGFVTLLSSGRTVHIALRDAQGKPKVSTQFLYTTEQSSGGLFGSIKNILGAGAWKQAVSALRTRSLERGQVQVLGLMERGELRVWDLDWSGHYSFRASVDFREQLQHELRQMRPVERQGDVEHLALLDLVVLDGPSHSSRQELVSAGAARPLDTIILIRCGTAGLHTYALVELSLTGNDFSIARVLDVHAESQATAPPHQPRILVPAPGHTAFVVLPDTVAVMSLAVAASNPEAQFHDASYIEPLPFQDAIYLRSDRGLAFSGGESDDSRQPTDASSIAFVDGAGLVRITAHNIQLETDESEPDISVRSRIEQAVFFGYQDTNILDLLRSSRKLPAEVDVEQAVLDLSKDILRSSSRHFLSPPTSISMNLQKRAEAAAHLAAYIQKLHPFLAPNVKWTLLSDAEKIAAGSKLWTLFEAQLNTSSKSKRRSTLLNEVCEIIKSRHSFESLWQHSTSDDIVRTFFVTELHHIEKLLPWTRRVLEDIRIDNQHSSAEILRLASEADDIWLGCLNTALSFRKDNVSHYGLRLRMIEHGTAPDPDDLRDVTELWTSSDDILKDVDKMVKLSRTAAQDVFESQASGSPEGHVMKIATENPELVDLMCEIYLERIAWCQSRGSEKYIVQGQRLREVLDIKRHDEIRQLAEVGQAGAGIVLAEKYRDMQTLTEVLIAESQYLQETMAQAAEIELEGLQDQANNIFALVTKYFDRFGDDFAEAFFAEGFADGKGGKMLSDAHSRWQAPMTKWLRKDASRAKICWINDVLQGRDYKHASTSLFDVGMDHEENNWNRKVELSLAKLSMNACFEDKSKDDRQLVLGTNQTIDNELQIVDVQDRLYQHIVPATYHSLDDEAAVEAAMEEFNRTLLAFSTWHQLMGQQMKKLLSHCVLSFEELVDLITLAESGANTLEDQDRSRSETFEALLVLYAARGLKSSRFDTLVKLCWKRAYLREDWEGINARASTESEEELREILSTTKVYQAMINVLESDVPTPGHQMTILEPAETLGAGCNLNDLSPYIPDELKENVLEENIIMERQMEAMIKEQGVQGWFQEMMRLAKNTVAARRLEDEQITPSSPLLALNGHPANGMNGIKTEEDEDDHRVAAFNQAPGQYDNDVQMS